MIFAYIEGELQRTTCANDDELVQELQRVADWHARHNGWKGIDPWNDELARRLEDAGAGHLVHAGRSRSDNPVHEANH